MIHSEVAKINPCKDTDDCIVGVSLCWRSSHKTTMKCCFFAKLYVSSLTSDRSLSNLTSFLIYFKTLFSTVSMDPCQKLREKWNGAGKLKLSESLQAR